MNTAATGLRARVGTKDASPLAECQRPADDDKALDAQTASSLILPAIQLKNGAKDRERVARVLRHAVAPHPSEFWAHYELSRVYGIDSGQIAELFPHPEELVRHLTAAVAIRPRSFGTHDSPAVALRAQGKFDEAVAEYREAIRNKPDVDEVLDNLRTTPHAQRRFDEEATELRVQLDPARTK